MAKNRRGTDDEAVSVLENNLPDLAIAFEERLDVPVTRLVRQVADVDSTRHTLDASLVRRFGPDSA